MGLMNPVDLLAVLIVAVLVYGLTKIQAFKLFDIGKIRTACELEKSKAARTAKETE